MRRESSSRKIDRRWRYSSTIMPRIDGMDTCRAIRQQENDGEHRLPVVIVAGREDLDRGSRRASRTG